MRVSQPGLGYQIKQLEEELQVQLLERHARGVSLTRAGETFLDHAESILAEINKAKLAMRALAHSDRQELRIGIASVLIEALGPALFSSNLQGEIKLRLKEASATELHEGLMNGSLDFAICLDEGRTPLKTIPVYSEPLYVVGPKSDLQSHQKRIRLTELAVLPLVLADRAHTPRRLLEEASVRAGIKLTVEQEIESVALLRSLVLQGACYTVAPYGIFAQELTSRSLSARRIVGPEIRQTVNVVYPATVPPSVEGTIGGVIQRIVSLAPVAADMATLVSTAAA